MVPRRHLPASLLQKVLCKDWWVLGLVGVGPPPKSRFQISNSAGQAPKSSEVFCRNFWRRFEPRKNDFCFLCSHHPLWIPHIYHQYFWNEILWCPCMKRNTKDLYPNRFRLATSQVCAYGWEMSSIPESIPRNGSCSLLLDGNSKRKRLWSIGVTPSSGVIFHLFRNHLCVVSVLGLMLNRSLKVPIKLLPSGCALSLAFDVGIKISGQLSIFAASK